ncbi:ESPR-type extended signal peptide-containing protein, partial [Psychrobacter sp. Ps7]|uniref:ESPR-type extended signal peptide-containing protein n=1 Tax=Psychrobacter sp. Ps7 TaxID=2790961 RepID=UPI001EDD6458
MNRNYKVIWNASLNCFMAVAEYAKARGKSSSGAVTSKASPTSSVVGGAKLLRLSSLCAGIALTGVSVQSIAAVNYQGDIGPNINALGTLNVKGGVSDATDLSDDNIGVISDSSPANVFGVKTLTIKLSKTLTGLKSADFGGVKISNTGIDAKNTQITQLYSAGDITLSSNALNAVNASDLNTAIADNKVKYFSVKSTLGTNEDNLGATGTDAIAIGKNAAATGTSSISMGTGASATNSESTALGAA